MHVFAFFKSSVAAFDVSREVSGIVCDMSGADVDWLVSAGCVEASSALASAIANTIASVVDVKAIIFLIVISFVLLLGANLQRECHESAT